MTNNDILRRIRFVFNFNDDTMITIFKLGGVEVTRAEVSDWLKQEEMLAFQELSDLLLAIFLNGLIIKRRGKKEGPQPVPETRLNNNLIFRKLKIALDFKDDDIMSVLAAVGFPIGKHELSALFRKPGHKNFRKCQTQLLRNFLKGLQLKYRPDVAATSESAPRDDDESDE